MEDHWEDTQARLSAGKTSHGISDDYLVGFVEGEGCFYVGIVKSRETITHWQVVYFFKVSQNPSGRVILEKLKEKLNCGYIKANSLTDTTDKSLAYVVRDLPSIVDKVIPFFKGKLFTKKSSDLDKFCEVVSMVSDGQHLKRTGMSKILEVAYSMNTGKRKYSKEEILKNFID